MINISIFASGTGSNARKIIEYFIDHDQIDVKLLVSNKANAKVLQLADEYDISTCIINKDYFYKSSDLINIHRKESIDLIILAGFLWLIPPYLLEAFPNKILNIHPSLLPMYGGKGMYGMHIHEAVKLANEKETGMTIHLVNKDYDKGEILFQSKCLLTDEDTPETIAKKVLNLEHKYYPKVIENFILERYLNY
jgi:phosphoribosylglycinamide formyltransferase-1